MLRRILNFFFKKRLPKDPMDWTKTNSSTEWKYEEYCPDCKATTDIKEQIAHACFSCGNQFWDLFWFPKRMTRKIWNGKKWVVQRKYGNGPNDYTIKPM